MRTTIRCNSFAGGGSIQSPGHAEEVPFLHSGGKVQSRSTDDGGQPRFSDEVQKLPSSNGRYGETVSGDGEEVSKDERHRRKGHLVGRLSFFVFFVGFGFLRISKDVILLPQLNHYVWDCSSASAVSSKAD